MSAPFRPRGVARARRLGVACLCAWSAACAATPLAPKFVPPETPTEAQVAANIEHAEAREERAVVVALGTDGRLSAFDLSGKTLWEVDATATSAPLLAGDTVVLGEPSGIAVRDLASGELRARVSRGAQLIGADGIADAIAISASYPEEQVTRAELSFVVGDNVRWQKALNQPIGVPALVKSQVLLPWATQRLSVLSADDGAELARFHFRNLMVGQARVDHGHVYLGQLGLLRVDDKLRDHQEGPVALIGPEKRSLPGSPPWLRDGYAPVPAPGHAAHKLKVEWSPASEGDGVEGDALLFRFYRMAFGLSAQGDALRWVRTFESDLVGSSPAPGGTLLVDAQGGLRFVEHDGTAHLLAELHKPLAVAAVRAGSPPLALGAGEPLGGPLHDQLLSAVEMRDDRLLPGRSYALRELAKLPDEGLTRELIALCSSAPDAPLRVVACEELGKRDGNPKDLLDALRLKASFLQDTSEPPVAALAQAAARLQLKQAVPLLLSHAQDPHTESTELPALFQALALLEAQNAVPPLERFVRLHHAEPSGSDLAPSLSAALAALGALHAKAAKPTLERVVSDGLTLESIRKEAQQALIAIDAPKANPQAPTETPRAAKVKQTAPPAVEVQSDPRPYALDAAAVREAFRPLRAALVECLDADADKPKSMRVALVIQASGRVEGIFVSPTRLQACSDAVLRTAQFPETQLARQQVHQTIYAEENVAPEGTTATTAGAPSPRNKAEPRRRKKR